MVLFMSLFLFSLYGTIYGSVLDETVYHIEASSGDGTYSNSIRSNSSTHYSGNGGYSSGK